MSKNNLITVLVCSAFVSACVPIYVPPSKIQIVGIHTASSNNMRICKDNQWYQLKQDANNNAYVQYGKRISIGNYYFQREDDGAYTTTASCFPKLSFVPQAHQQYYFNFMIDGKKCIVEILRYSSANKTGLVAEKSMSKDLTCLPK